MDSQVSVEGRIKAHGQTIKSGSQHSERAVRITYRSGERLRPTFHGIANADPLS